LSYGGGVKTGAVCYEQANCLIKCINEQILGKSAVLQHGRHQQQGMILKGLQVSKIREDQWTRLRAKHQGSRLIVVAQNTLSSLLHQFLVLTSRK